MICPKKSGNTYRVCQYVCGHSGAELGTADTSEEKSAQPDLSCYDVIILASGVYANHLHPDMRKFIRNMRAENLSPNTKIYLLLTWIGRGTSDRAAFLEAKRLLEEKGIKIEENFMKCFGRMGIVRLTRPNRQDCENVLSWVKELKGGART